MRSGEGAPTDERGVQFAIDRRRDGGWQELATPVLLEAPDVRHRTVRTIARHAGSYRLRPLDGTGELIHFEVPAYGLPRVIDRPGL